MDPIIKTQCADEDRLDFLPNNVGKHFLRYENLTYDFMRKACKDYSGGFWDYQTLSNGGFYMTFQTDKKLRLVWPDNYFDDEMSADAASICIGLMTQNAFAWHVEPEKFTDKYHALLDYAAQHKEAGLIYAFIN